MKDWPRAAAPMFHLAIAELPFLLPIMRKMMQSQVARSKDEGLL